MEVSRQKRLELSRYRLEVIASQWNAVSLILFEFHKIFILRMEESCAGMFFL